MFGHGPQTSLNPFQTPPQISPTENHGKQYAGNHGQQCDHLVTRLDILLHMLDEFQRIFLRLDQRPNGQLRVLAKGVDLLLKALLCFLGFKLTGKIG